jgi:hypothetical protein
MTTPDEPSRAQRITAAALGVLVTAGVAFGLAMFAIGRYEYGWTLFLGIPFAVGFISAAVLRARGTATLRRCLTIASCASFVLALALLALGKEGLICVVMSIPIVVPLAILGAWTGFMLLHRQRVLPPGGSVSILVALLAVGPLIEGRLHPKAPNYTVRNAVVVNAPADRVWSALLSLGPLGQPPDLLFRVGVACPQRVDIYGRGVGADRVCTLSTGRLHERITVWEPGRRLAWVSLSTPPPLRELNPFRETDPPHLHGFYRSLSGSFELESLGPGVTRVTRYSTYEHNLYPAAYWRIWCDFVAERGHVHVLGVLRDIAEGRAPPVENPRLGELR